MVLRRSLQAGFSNGGDIARNHGSGARALPGAASIDCRSGRLIEFGKPGKPGATPVWAHLCVRARSARAVGVRCWLSSQKGISALVEKFSDLCRLNFRANAKLEGRLIIRKEYRLNERLDAMRCRHQVFHWRPFGSHHEPVVRPQLRWRVRSESIGALWSDAPSVRPVAAGRHPK